MGYKSNLDGRMEKRIPVAIVVRLTHAQDQPANGAELTCTDNVSAHGARVVSSRPWRTGAGHFVERRNHDPRKGCLLPETPGRPLPHRIEFPWPPRHVVRLPHL